MDRPPWGAAWMRSGRNDAALDATAQPGRNHEPDETADACADHDPPWWPNGFVLPVLQVQRQHPAGAVTSEDAESSLGLVRHQLGRPRRSEDQVRTDLADALDRSQEGTDLILDQRADRAAHRREAVGDVDVPGGLD